MYIKLEEIDATQRVREEYGDEEMGELITSISRHGQLQEAVVTRENGHYILIAGGRRYRAIAEIYKQGKDIPYLPSGTIRCDLREEMQPHTKKLLEAEENFKRKDFTFMEKAKFIREFHEMMIQNHTEVWTAELTAYSLGVSAASISHYLRVEEAARDNPHVAQALTLDAAVKRMKVVERTKVRIEKAKVDESHHMLKAQDILYLDDCRKWIKDIQSESQDFINFDPPWGGDISHRVQEAHVNFDDSTEYSDKLILEMLPELFRVLKQDRFMFFWLDVLRINETKEWCKKVGFNFTYTELPCFWYKQNKVNSLNRNPERQVHNVIETFLMVRKGDPIFHKQHSRNVLPFDLVPKSLKIHGTEKPLDLCGELLKIATVPGESVLDPTAGSAAMLHAALLNGRKPKGCEYTEKLYQAALLRLISHFKGVENV